MKRFFEDPRMEVIAFAVEDTITVSGLRGGIGMNPGFDEIEPDANQYIIHTPPIMPPCL